LGRTVVNTKEALVTRARSVLRSLQKSSDLIKRFFHESHAQYVVTWCRVRFFRVITTQITPYKPKYQTESPYNNDRKAFTTT